MDLGFGFNNAIYSDRVLHIEVLADSDGGCSPEENVVKVETLNICSLLLAGNSPFFHKLFENGMRESHELDVTLRINASEEVALRDILQFTYTRTLNATTISDVLDVLIVADKFEVTSCIKYCSELLQNITMSLESAISYLKLPESVLVGESTQLLVNAAKQYLVSRYSNFDKSEKKMMDLPLCAVEVVLGGHGLRVDSEDDVYDFVCKWARRHYPKLEERREILTKRLARCICFSCMSCLKLKEVLVSQDFDNEQVLKLVIEALFLKVEVPCEPLYLQFQDAPCVRPIHVPKDPENTKCNSLGRNYKLRCVVYFDLRKEECDNLFPWKDIYSQSFGLGGRWFYLNACCYTEQNAFALYLFMTKESESCTVDYKFDVVDKSTKKFQFKAKDVNINSSRLMTGYGTQNLFGISWTDFISEESEYFVDGILHLRVDLAVNISQD